MVSWLTKALVQRGIGALPNPHYWNELLQKRFTRSLDLSVDRFEESLANCRHHLRHLERFGPATRRNDFTAFELGTGWYPAVAIGFFLCGVREVWTWDVVPFVTRDRLKATIGRFIELELRQGLADRLPVMPERLARLREVMDRCDQAEGPAPAALLEELGVHYRIGNAGQTGLPSQCVDLITSDVVFEYLSPGQLSQVLREFGRIGTSDVVMSHTIDLSDQYAAQDPRITLFNFLRFSDFTWRCLNNPIIPLNRLRVSDYRRAFNANGFEIVEQKDKLGDPAELARTPLAPRFRDYAPEDLLVTFTRLAALRSDSRTDQRSVSLH